MQPTDIKSRLDGSKGSQSLFERATYDYIVQLERALASASAESNRLRKQIASLERTV